MHTHTHTHTQYKMLPQWNVEQTIISNVLTGIQDHFQKLKIKYQISKYHEELYFTDCINL